MHQDLYDDIATLQAWFSPAFPIGTFSYSHGLETAIFTNVVRDRKTLFDWISDLLNYGTGRNDGCFVVRSFNNEPGINDLCLCLSAGKERLIETLEMGQAFIRAVNSSYNLSLPGGLAFPVAVGAAAQKMDLDLRITLQSYLQSFAANLISVGVRTIPIGQQAGQDCLVDLTPTFKKVSKEIMNSPIGDFGSSTTLSDIMAMKHEDTESRIYRT